MLPTKADDIGRAPRLACFPNTYIGGEKASPNSGWMDGWMDGLCGGAREGRGRPCKSNKLNSLNFKS